jgi:hypothetical protein
MVGSRMVGVTLVLAWGCGATPPSQPTSKPAADAAPKVTAPSSAKVGPEGVAGFVVLAGEPVAMEVPTQRHRAAFCNQAAVVHNAVRTGAPDANLGGRPLQDVLVHLAEGAVPASTGHGTLHLDYRECVREPRTAGLQAGGKLVAHNHDPTMHNLNVEVDDKTLFNLTLPPDQQLDRVLTTVGMHRVSCDVHVWETSFVRVLDHPYFAVTDRAGRFAIAGVPNGRYPLVAWHARYGEKQLELTVEAGKSPSVTFVYQGNEAPPKVNHDELDLLFCSDCEENENEGVVIEE